MTVLGAMANALRVDGWENVILGLGGTKDPSIYTTHTARGQISDAVLESLYVEDHFAARIVEAVVKTALRPGWDLHVPGDPADTAGLRSWYAAREDELEVAAELSQGACWGRLFGGAVTWIGVEDGRPVSEPLDEANVQTVKWLHTFDRRDVQVWTRYQSPEHPRFRQPETYRIRPVLAGAIAAAFAGRNPSAGGIVVHESRCVVWPGQPTTDARRLVLSGWDDSVLERCWEPLKQLAEDYGAKSLLLGRISQMVYKIKNLWKLLAGKEREVLERRMGLLEASRSRARAILLDTEEDAVNITQSIAGVPEIIDRGTLRLASAADMPATVLMGQSPAGQNATGDSDLELWAGTCGAWRESVLRRRHERITRLLLLSKDAPTGGKEPDGQWSVKYRPLREPTRKEIAEVRKLEADTDAINIDKGIYTAEDAAFRYASSGSAEIVLDEKALREKQERKRALAAQPPKDNAELGTVGARTTAVLEIVEAVIERRVPRETGLTMLVELHRYTLDVATKLLGPETFVPAPRLEGAPPGPAPTPPNGSGAGAPPQLPGVNAGGAR